MKPFFRQTMSALLVPAILSIPGVVSAQQTVRVRPTMVAINPLGIAFDVFQGELENTVAPGFTLGVAASHVEDSDVSKRTTAFDLKMRYYPNEESFNQASVGLSAGWARFTSGTETLATPTIGVYVDYNWLEGKSKRFVIGTGVGAKRIIATEFERNRVDLDRAALSLRFVVGMTF